MIELKKIMVCGAGQMGNGIAQICAQAGFDIIVYDIKPEFLERGMGVIRKNLQRSLEKNKITQEEHDNILSRITSTTALEMASEADVVIEAIPENEALKKELFAQLDTLCPSHTIFASNTSAISITKLGSATKRPEKVIGMHFINPVPVMKIVEIIEANLTSQETTNVIEKLAVDLGKVVVKAKDFAGFMTTRLIMPFMNEAMYMVYEGKATIEDIDTGAKLGLNHPMGPFEWIDLVGLDSMLSILTNLWESLGERKYFPCPLLVQMVDAGRLGRKVGRGFYNYD